MKFKSTLFILMASLLNISTIISMHTVAITRHVHKKTLINKIHKNNFSAKTTTTMNINDLYKKIESEEIKNISTNELREITEDLDVWACSERYGTNKPCWNPHCGRNLYPDSENNIDKTTAKNNQLSYLNLKDKSYFNRAQQIQFRINDLSILHTIEKETLRRYKMIYNPNRMIKTDHKECHNLETFASNLKHKKRCIKNKLQALVDAEKWITKE